MTILGSVPFAGTYLEMAALGGEYPGESLLPRLYAMHILLVPGLMAALITMHLMLVTYLKHTQWAGPGRTGRNAVGRPMFLNSRPSRRASSCWSSASWHSSAEQLRSIPSGRTEAVIMYR